MDEHRGAFEYDWRTRFGISLRDVPRLMDWAEAWRLTLQLSAEPSSHVAAAVAGWNYPLSRESLDLRDLFDLEHQSKAKRKPKPKERPWDRRPAKYGTAISLDDYRALRPTLE